MTLRTPFRVVLWMVAVTLMAQSAYAYNWNKCRSNKQTWNSNSETFRPSSVSFPAGSAWRASIEATRTAWNTAPGTRFDFNYTYSTSSTYSSGDGNNSILRNTTYNWDSDNDPTTITLGVAIRRHKWCVWPFWGGKLKEADVLFNDNLAWNTATNPVPPFLGLNSTLVGIHELGHAFGLDHENNVMATMNSFYPNSGPIGRDNDVVPHGDDVLGDRAGYGTSGSPRDLYASTYRRTGSGRSDEITAPATLFRATPTGFQYTMGNRGAVNETSVGVKFYLSTDRTITTGDHLLGSAGFSVNQGTASTRTVNITVPGSVPAGLYFFGWIVDPENYIPEVDEGNNSVALVGRTRVRDESPPNACFTATPTFGNAPLLVTVNAGCSSDSDGTITSYTWNMGDGSTRTGQSFSYRYFEQGVFTIRLTVRDNSNLTDQATRFINVRCGLQLPEEDGPPCELLQ